MKKTFLYLFAASLLFGILPGRDVTAQGTGSEEEPQSGAVVCAPDVYLIAPDDCLPLGPSTYITDMAKLGLTFPPRSLPAYKPDPALTQLPYHYFKLEEDTVPILSAPAGNDTGQSFQPGFVYVSYVDRVESDGVYYMLQNGGWIPGKGSRIGDYPRFQGLQFKSTPHNAFAWPLPIRAWSIPVYRAPSYNAPLTGKTITPQADMVQVYATQNAEGVDWNMIGPDQWVEASQLAAVTPNTTPPEGVTTGRWIDVNLAEQTLAVYDNYQLVFATVVATGLEPFWTRPGLFQIYQKKESETMRNNDPTDYYYLDNVPWTMYFDKARALHGAYWRTQFGFTQSHGCVNLSVGDSHWLFDWAHEGDYVYVHDPSGLTPTDPALYHDWAY
ncbi:MAG TPA: L,D-transpeptidase [Anaerolineales bacterium]|nr:L,D-transpeptidase [Anaerolineales bacterium]